MAERSLANRITPNLDTPFFRRFRHYAGIALAFVLIGLILRSISIAEVQDAIRTLNVGFLLLAYGLNIAVVMLMAYRWWTLYTINVVHPTYVYLLKVSFIGVLFNNLLPGTIGGDVYRALHMGHSKSEGRQYSRSVAIVFLDRLTGLLGLVLIGTVAAVLTDNSAVPGHVGTGIFITLALFVVGLYLSMSRRFYTVVARLFLWLPEPYRSKIEQSLFRIRDHIVVFSNRKRLVFAALLVSITQRSVWLWGCYLIGVALDLDLSPLTFFVFLPIIEIIRVLPLTVQGIGIREGLFVLFFGSAGVTNSQATLLAVLVYTLLSLNGLIGGALYLWDKRHIASNDSAGE